jgi:hypothetical protein
MIAARAIPFTGQSMVSTYLSFDLVNRDITASLKRVASQTQVSNEATYYKENIGKVKTVDEFLDNYRLYSYAMTAFGLEDMTYAKAFMKKILESDLSDSSSFANRMTDDRYKQFAASFNFGTASSDAAVAQSDAQMQDTFDLYDQTIAQLGDKTDQDTRYFKAMMGTVGNVKTVDQFLHDDELRQTVFTAYGIDDTYFKYDDIKNVLTSDPNDPNSYYSKTYGAYNSAQTEKSELQERQTLSTSIPTLQDSIDLGTQRQSDLQNQLDAKQAQQDGGDSSDELQAEIDDLQSQLDETNTLLASDQENLTTSQARYDELDAKLVPMDQADSRLAELAKVLNKSTSDLSYMQKMKALAEDFNFNSDGTVPSTGVLSSDKIDEIIGKYFDGQERVTQAEATFNQSYFEKKVATATNVDDFVSDDRIFNYLRSAFGLTQSYIVKSTIEQILTSDLSDPDSYANQYADTRPGYVALAKAFSFNTDGTVEAGKAQTTAQANTTRSNYSSGWDDKQEADEATAITHYKSDMASIESLDDFLSTDASETYNFALKAVGIDPDSISKFKIRQILQSDLSDPKSFVYQQKDERFVSLAKLFNFDNKGKPTVPVLAQSNAAITNTGSEYVLRKTRFLTGTELDAAKKTAETESTYYTTTMQGITTRDELLGDRRLLDIALTAKGIDPTTVTDDFLKQIFTSDLNDANSFVNKQTDKRFAQLVGSFNFTSDGEIDRSTAKDVQNAGEVMATQNMYLRQTLETEQGEDNNGVRLALYFERMADSITDPYVIIGDDALAEFFRVTFSMSTEFANMDVDKQAAVIKKNLNLQDLSDPDKLSKLLTRFTTMYDLENSDTSTNPAVSILSGSSGSAGISADTLFALSQLKLG